MKIKNNSNNRQQIERVGKLGTLNVEPGAIVDIKKSEVFPHEIKRIAKFFIKIKEPKPVEPKSSIDAKLGSMTKKISKKQKGDK